MASWRTEPKRTSGRWLAFRQVSPDWPPLYHSAGVPSPDQASGRWHRLAESYAQYMSLVPLSAWAECARYFSLRSAAHAREMKRNLWMVYVRETAIADLSTFGRYDACGLDPRIAVGEHNASQALADELRAAGYRGVLSPAAALADAVNLTVFGERYEQELAGNLTAWRNPDRDAWLPVSLVAEEAGVPVRLCTETVFQTKKHLAYRRWMRAHGRDPGPTAP